MILFLCEFVCVCVLLSVSVCTASARQPLMRERQKLRQYCDFQCSVVWYCCCVSLFMYVCITVVVAQTFSMCIFHVSILWNDDLLYFKFWGCRRFHGTIVWNDYLLYLKFWGCLWCGLIESEQIFTWWWFVSFQNVSCWETFNKDQGARTTDNARTDRSRTMGVAFSVHGTHCSPLCHAAAWCSQ